MPKTLQNEICRSDTKKSASNAFLASCKKISPSFGARVVPKKLLDPTTKKSSLTHKLKELKYHAPLPSDNDKTLKARKNTTATITINQSVKTRSGTGKKVVNVRVAKSKMKEKSKTLTTDSKVKAKDEKVKIGRPKQDIKRTPVSIISTAVKRDAKKVKSESMDSVKNTSLESSTPLFTLSKKESKKRKEHQVDADENKEGKKLSKVSKKEEITVADVGIMKRESQESPTEKPGKELKVTRSDEVDEKCMAPKKRLKQKCAKEAAAAAAAAAVAEVELLAKETIKKEATCGDKEVTPESERKLQPSDKNIKFFKSKSKKSDKIKDTSIKVKDSHDLKEAFSVYDNIDEDHEEPSKPARKKSSSVGSTKNKVVKIGKETEIKMKQHLEAFKKSKMNNRKSGEKPEKRKLDTGSENETEIKSKKAKRCDASGPTKANKSKLKKSTTSKVSNEFKVLRQLVEEDSPCLSSDDAPLNRLISTKRTKMESMSDNKQSVERNAMVAKSAIKCESRMEGDDNMVKLDAELETRNKIINSKSKIKTMSSKSLGTKKKKSGNEEKKTTQEAKNKKSVRFSKPSVVSKSSVKSTRKRRQRMASLNALAMVHCMYENEGKSVSVSSFDSTETSDDYNTSEVKTQPVAIPEVTPAVVKAEPQVEAGDAMINRESLRSAPGVRSIGKHWDMNGSSISSTMSDLEHEATAHPSVPTKELLATEKIKNNNLKKKFERTAHRHVFEDSSEEDKHQELLLEEKKRMMRRRRRQRKEITMDLKDMVVCKRMASLNATAILAASYSSSTTGKRTITVKSGNKEKKSDNVENFEKTESVITKIKGRMRKKFSSSSDADVEDEADLSGSEMVVKTASNSAKQQVSLIVNQDSGVTITGLYLNSTTKSTHHQGYCSISGMQYRISSTSHTQTEATTVTTEAIVRTPQEPLRPPMTVSMHADRREMSPSRNGTLSATHAHASPVKTYTPLGALSSMQPPGSPHHVHHLHHLPKTMTIASTQEISSLERHGCPSAFSTPSVYGPPPPLNAVAARPPYPILSKTPPEPGFVAGYYQPAGPLISHHHHHHHHHHHVQTNATTTTTSTVGLPAMTATSVSSSAATIPFAKISQSPLVQPPTPPASNVTQPVSETSDNEMASATTPSAEITVSENPSEESNYSMNYRFNASANPPPFRSPSHNYQNYYPSPPSTASLSQSHPPPPQQQAHYQEVLCSSNPPTGPPGLYHLGYMQPKGPPYHSPLHRRYIPNLQPPQYFHPEYSAAVTGSQQQQQVIVPAHHPLTTSAAESYHPAPPPPSVIESYPPPPPPLYYSGYSSAPPPTYYPYATSSRSLTLVETSCPCPLQGCQKNVHTGPLTGISSKGPVKQRNTPLSPVALSLPREPQDIRSLPSPARGSAGSRPTASPAIATAKHPSSWNEGSDYGYDTPGLLTISKSSNDSIVDQDSGIDGTDISPIKTKRKLSDRRQMKKLKMRKTREALQLQGCKDEQKINRLCSTFYDSVQNTDTTEILPKSQVMDFVPRLKSIMPEVVEMNVTDTPDNVEEQMDELIDENRLCCKRWSGEEENSSEPEMPKLYPEVSPFNVENRHSLSPSPGDDQPLAKRVRFSDESKLDMSSSPVDMEKNNYLSALQLCSVNELENKLDTKQIEKNLAPSRHLEEQHCTRVPVETKMNSPPELSLSQQMKAEMIKEDTLLLDIENEVNGMPPLLYKTITVPSMCSEPKKPRFRRRRWTSKKKKKNKRKNSKASKAGSEEEKLEAENAERRRRAELLSLTQKRTECRLKWSNGWTWLGEPFVAKVFLNTEGSEVLRICYHAMKHQSGDIIRPKDCILLRSGCKKTDLPYVAKVAHLWEDPEDGEMMISLFWYYRPEHTEHEAVQSESPYELYASKHKDMNSVACIEDKCYVLTFNEYCRYHKSIRQTEESVDVSSVIVPPLGKKRYPRQALLPPENTSLDLVFFCRKIYDFRQHRLLKNPFFV